MQYINSPALYYLPTMRIYIILYEMIGAYRKLLLDRDKTYIFLRDHKIIIYTSSCHHSSSIILNNSNMQNSTEIISNNLVYKI